MPLTSPAQPAASLRRVRSTGDIPQHLDRVHVQRGSHRTSTYSGRSPETVVLPLRGAVLDYREPVPPITLSSVELPRVPDERDDRPRASPVTDADMPWYRKAMVFLGLGRHAAVQRRNLVVLIIGLLWRFCQVVVVTTLLALIGTVMKSPTNPALTEWKACDRPLGIWGCLWICRTFLASGLTYWEYVRGRLSQPHPTAVEEGRAVPTPNASPTQREHQATLPAAPSNIGDPHTAHSPDHPDSSIDVPHTRLYRCLTLLSSLLTLSWFLTAHILEYTSVNTCRRASPHLWWLTFGILCILYLTILEVFIFGFVLLIIAPILFVFWNIFLICIGRHPMQNPHMIKPEIGKLPKSVVDRIPLVLYIPPPPRNTADISPVPEPECWDPPQDTRTPTPSRSHFRFLRSLSPFNRVSEKRGNRTDTTVEKGSEDVGNPTTWEGNWERGDYPFVVLESNRAACAICLMDFGAPRRKRGLTGGDNAVESTANEGISTDGTDANAAQGASRGTSISQLLKDAGDGAQPLRLLSCGHVFHKTCLDPWLTDVSGRCPVCQEAVEPPERPKKRKQERRPR